MTLSFFSWKNITFIFNLFRSSSNAVFFAFVLTFFLNFLASLMEGLAYCFVILAFSTLANGTLDPLYIDKLPGIIFLTFKEHLFLFFVVCGVVSQILKSTLCFLATLVNAKFATKLQYTIQLNVYRQILALSFACVNRYKIGQLVEYLRSPAYFIRPFLECFNGLVVSSCLIGVSLFILSKISFSLTLVSITLFVCSLVLQKYLIKKINVISNALSQNLEKFSVKALQSLNGLRIIHLYNSKENALANSAGALKKFASFSGKLIISNAAIVSINETVGILIVSFCLISGNWLLPGNLPALLGFVTVAYRLSGKVLMFMSNLNGLTSLSGCLHQIKAIMNKEDKEYAQEGEKKVNSIEKEIAFHNVLFSYVDKQKPEINGVTYKIPVGSTVAIVGKSGAGKSTLLDLLVGLYTPNEGKILIDGYDLSQCDLKSWREQIGVVTQDTFIFDDTIEENIRFGNSTVTQENVYSAAKSANAHHFISHLPQGYKTIVGERGYKLSGGERQRIALARALIRDPQILILDEATSNLDTQSELVIQESLAKFKGKKTLIIVAHRLSTIKSADTILVFEKGEIIEQGSHDVLIKLQGNYAKFWDVQCAAL